jgi:hypothetical protein
MKKKNKMKKKKKICLPCEQHQILLIYKLLLNKLNGNFFSSLFVYSFLNNTKGTSKEELEEVKRIDIYRPISSPTL